MNDAAKSPALAQLIENGSTLFQQGRFPEAEATCHQVLAADADNNLGNAFLELGELNEAEKCFRKALQLNAGFALAQCNLAVVLLLRGDLAAGLPLYERRFAGADRSQVAMSQRDSGNACRQTPLAR